MRLLLWLTAAAMLLASATTVPADPLKIRVAWVVVPNNLPPILFAKPGIKADPTRWMPSTLPARRK
jgi:hypothetical protein